MNTPGVYAIVHRLTGHRYVGSSNRMENRWSKHRGELRRGIHHCRALQLAWQVDGERSFEFVMLEVVFDIDERVRREQFYIDNALSLYNTVHEAYVANQPNHTMGEARRAHLSRALKGKSKSPEHRAALSAAMKGRKNPKHAEAIRGRKASAETREKMRAAHTGLRQSQETCAKRGEKLKGRVFSPEWKAKISAAKRGKPWSERRLNALRASQAGSSASAVSMSDLPAMAPHDHVTH